MKLRFGGEGPYPPEAGAIPSLSQRTATPLLSTPELSTIESFFQAHTKRFEKQFETLRKEFSGKRKRLNGHAG